MTEYFELPDGFTFSVRSIGRTIGEGDFSAMTNLSWTTSQLHANKAYMEQAYKTERMLAGGCVLAFALGLASPTALPLLAERKIAFRALVGFDEVRFQAPLFPGDTIAVDLELVSVSKTTRANRGVLNFRDTVSDDTGRVIVTYGRSALADISESVLYRPSD